MHPSRISPQHCFQIAFIGHSFCFLSTTDRPANAVIPPMINPIVPSLAFKINEIIKAKNIPQARCNLVDGIPFISDKSCLIHCFNIRALRLYLFCQFPFIKRQRILFIPVVGCCIVQQIPAIICNL